MGPCVINYIKLGGSFCKRAKNTSQPRDSPSPAWAPAPLSRPHPQPLPPHIGGGWIPGLCRKSPTSEDPNSSAMRRWPSPSPHATDLPEIRTPPTCHRRRSTRHRPVVAGPVWFRHCDILRLAALQGKWQAKQAVMAKKP